MPSKEILEQHQLVRVTFELPPDVQGSVVHLVGDFTGWEGVPMKRSDQGGWTTTVDLAPGRSFEFRYLVDGERWENDWDADRYVRSPFGHDNSVVDTPALDAPETAVQHGAAGQGPARDAADRTITRKADAKQASPKGGGRTPTGPAAKKTVAKKQTAKKTAAKKQTAKTTAAKKQAATKTAAKKSPAKKAPSKKAPTKSGAGGAAESAPENGSRAERRDNTSGGR